MQVNMLEEVSKFITVDKYCRYNEKKKRRETWIEAIDRVEEMHMKKYDFLDEKYKKEISWAFDLVREKFVMPSMRSIQFGGRAIEAHNLRMYNCCARHIDSIRAFSEVFYALLCGCGVGLGIIPHFQNRLPDLVGSEDKNGIVVNYQIEDTIEGWADSLEAILRCYFKNTAYTGRKIVFDYSRIRSKGAILKTGGGKAPGYKPLKAAHQRIKFLLDYLIEQKGNKRLRSIDIYDILMHCGDCVLSGGSRRTATSVVFDKNDELMLNAKVNFKVTKYKHFEQNEKTKKWEGIVYIEDNPHGGYHHKYEVELEDYEYQSLRKNHEIDWFKIEPQRGRSNNSVLLLRDSISHDEFKKIVERTKQWGEPGFVFANHPWTLFNPCFEIGFIPVTEDGVCGLQVCNLSSMNGAKIKTKEKFKECVKAQTIIGTLQAGYTDFPYLNNTAKFLTEQEALLGNSITGTFDTPKLFTDKVILTEMTHYAVKINQEWAKTLKINPAARIGCQKPEGTGAKAFGASSGNTPWRAHKFFLRVQVNKQDPIGQYLASINPHAIEESVWSVNKTDNVITFPLELSKEAMVIDDLDAIRHLEYIKIIKQSWVDESKTPANKKDVSHNCSCTVYVKDEEWDKVIDYLYDNRGCFAAVSLLPMVADKAYRQAPQEKVTTQEDESKFIELFSKWKPVKYEDFIENYDETELVLESSCAGGQCAI